MFHNDQGKGTQRLHRFKPISRTQMEVYDISSNIPLRTVQIAMEKDAGLDAEEEEPIYPVGSFIACMALDCVWMGVVEELSAVFGDYLIKVLHPAGYSPEYHWPDD